jgi:hypothetical protein
MHPRGIKFFSQHERDVAYAWEHEDFAHNYPAHIRLRTDHGLPFRGETIYVHPNHKSWFRCDTSLDAFLQYCAGTLDFDSALERIENNTLLLYLTSPAIEQRLRVFYTRAYKKK